MREIKFRTCYKSRISPVGSLTFHTDGSILVNDELITDVYDTVIIMQYTGLKDKHGNDIYEGDWVGVSTQHHGYEEGEVKFIDGCFGMYHQHIFYPFYENEPIEIIGNIYEPGQEE